MSYYGAAAGRDWIARTRSGGVAGVFGVTMEGLEERFHDEMLDIYRRAKAECGYNAIRFLQLVTDKGGLAAAKTLLKQDGFSDGFTALWEHQRLDLSMESRVLQEPWNSLFTAEELSVARKRLEQLGYAPMTRPAPQKSPQIVVFEDDDEAYLAWLAENPNGFVLNTTRPPGSGYAKLHDASCHTVCGTPASGSTWTSGDYAKVCGPTRALMEAWVERELGCAADPCGTCFG